VAIVVLALWTITVAVGVYLLISSSRRDSMYGEQVPEEEPAAVGAPAKRRADLYDPPSLRVNKSEPIPGGRAAAEFLHPALAITGFAFWLLYALIHARIFEIIGLGILAGAIIAGLAWAAVNSRASKRGADDALIFPPRVLILHVVGAALTLILGALILTGVI
jgi:hypothetical protein